VPANNAYLSVFPEFGVWKQVDLAFGRPGTREDLWIAVSTFPKLKGHHWRAAGWSFSSFLSGHVAVGFMPAFKHNQKTLMAVLERGHKAHGYVHS
jgi:hypothetical protein